MGPPPGPVRASDWRGIAPMRVRNFHIAFTLPGAPLMPIAACRSLALIAIVDSECPSRHSLM